MEFSKRQVAIRYFALLDKEDKLKAELLETQKDIKEIYGAHKFLGNIKGIIDKKPKEELKMEEE